MEEAQTHNTHKQHNKTLPQILAHQLTLILKGASLQANYTRSVIAHLSTVQDTLKTTSEFNEFYDEFKELVKYDFDTRKKCDALGKSLEKIYQMIEECGEQIAENEKSGCVLC